jgi:hypothetical protein
MTTALLHRHKLDIGIDTHARLSRGWVLTEIRDNKLYKGVADTFKEYLSQDDVRSDAMECMRLYRFFIQKLGLLSEDIEDIHYKRLLEISKVATEKDIDYWLDDCRVLSWKDLINAVRGVQEKPPMPLEKSPPEDSPACILHPTRPAERHHWPQTKGAGGKSTMPLCRECHDEFHRHGAVTFWENHHLAIG